MWSPQHCGRCYLSQQHTLIPLHFPTGTTCDPSTTAAGPVGDQEARLGLQRLDEAVCELFSQGLAESTRAVYRSGWRQYTRFCHKFSISPLPVHEHTICQFAADLSASVGWETIRSYLSAVRFYQISARLPDPALAALPMLSYVLKGIHRKIPDSTRSKRLPITPHLLHKMHAVWSQGQWTFNNAMLWAACCLGFFGFMRAGEFTSQSSTDASLLANDVAVDSRSNPQVLIVHIRHSKTDPFSAGTHLFLGRTGDILCPVAAVLGYLAVRPSNPGPLFVLQDGTPLSRAHLVTSMREALSQAGENTSHFLATVSASVLPPRQHKQASVTHSYKHSADGNHPLSYPTSGPQ